MRLGPCSPPSVSPFRPLIACHVSSSAGRAHINSPTAPSPFELGGMRGKLECTVRRDSKHLGSFAASSHSNPNIRYLSYSKGMMTVGKKHSHSWLFNGHKNARLSPWLRSTLSELDQKTRAMLEVVEEDADSFAKCAALFYEKRPKLVNIIEDLYRAHRSLAERYDQLKLKIQTDKSSDSSSDSFDSYDSEVDDLQQESELDSLSDETKLMLEEIERLKEENCVLNTQVKAKDDEKREVIRQLSSSICYLKEENAGLKRCIKDSKNWGLFEFKKLKNIFLSGTLFG